MKKKLCILLVLAMALSGCQRAPEETTQPAETTVPESQSSTDAVVISLDGSDVYAEDGAGVYTANDIVYYEAGHDFTYGEGEIGDVHSPELAESHTVVHITQPGIYRLSGTLSLGQIAVDLGDNAKDDPNAVVTLILDGVDITCQVAPAIIFYNVYECGSADAEAASAMVDTSAAGANVILAEGSENVVSGSYVAKIYREGTVELSEDGTEVVDAKKLHKYDAAFYSKMSMNISGSGNLTIHAENEGLDSELHLTINGGNITINSGNDGINTNADGVSVTTVNGGSLTIHVNGSTGEGDGIDSNGWLVINGGTVIASACGFSGDAGIDSDMGILLNGGTVVASGHMLDRIAGGTGTWAVFQFAQTQKGGQTYTLKNEAGETVMECAPSNDFSCLILCGEALTPGTYSFWQEGTQLAAASGSMGGGPGFFGGMEGNVGVPGDVPGGFDGQPPEGDYQIPGQPGGQMAPQGGQMPGMPEGEMPTIPEGQTPPEGMGQRPQGGRNDGFGQMGALSGDFILQTGENHFTRVAPIQ